MKYKIIIQKKEENKYLAYCPDTHVLTGSGSDIPSAMSELKEQLLCHLHDPHMELEIVLEKNEAGKHSDAFNMFIRKQV